MLPRSFAGALVLEGQLLLDATLLLLLLLLELRRKD
jgi:hypothetical protein